MRDPSSSGGDQLRWLDDPIDQADLQCSPRVDDVTGQGQFGGHA
jgi:hypothetical protein